MDPQPDQSPPLESSQPSAPQPSSWQRLASRMRAGINPALAVAIVMLALLAAWWVDTRGQIHGLQQELVRKLAESDGYNKESRQAAAQARDTVRDLEYRLGAIESRVAETQNQRLALDALYLELTRN